MCIYKSFLVTKGNLIHWYWGDKHSALIAALGLDDTLPLQQRSFVAIECADGLIENYRVEEAGTLPAWFKDNRVHKRIAELLSLIVARKPEREALNARWQTEREALDARWMPELEALNARWRTEREALDARWQTEREALYAGLPGYVPGITNG